MLIAYLANSNYYFARRLIFRSTYWIQVMWTIDHDFKPILLYILILYYYRY